MSTFLTLRSLRRTAFVSRLLAAAGLPLSLGGQTPSMPSSTVSMREASDLESPRASVERFLQLARAGHFDSAANYLDLDARATEGARLARQLKAVLDRYAWIDLDALSPSALGDTTDGLPTLVDQVATIPDVHGGRRPVRVSRTTTAGEFRWRFTQGTVASIPGWYATLDDRWLRERLPAPLLRPGPFDVLWWQWVALPALLALASGIGVLARSVARPLLSRLVSRTRTDWDDRVLDRLGAPFAAAASIVAFSLLLPRVGLYAPAQAAAYRAVRATVLFLVFWSLLRLTDVVRVSVASSRWASASRASRSLLPLGGRIAKIGIVIIGAIAVLSFLGYPVTSLIAGLGIGGLAFALAAQKTVENLFGAFSIGVDQPFREGDFVRVDDFVGTVEAIGLRSTRFRTLDRTVVTLPNGKLADMRLESFTERDRLRLATTVGLVYETSAEQLRQTLGGFEGVLRAHPLIWPDAVVVRFSAFAASSLDIEIMAWFRTADWSEFQLIRQEVLLQFMHVVERAGTSFAFPTQTVHLVSEGSTFETRGNGLGASKIASV